MMIRLTKEEVEALCERWFRGRHHCGESRATLEDQPIAIDLRKYIKCTLTREGMNCVVLLETPTAHRAEE